MKENVIVISSKNEMDMYKEVIEYACNIVAGINYLNLEIPLDDWDSIGFEEINMKQYDRIILACGSPYYEIIYPVLSEMLGIDPTKIQGLRFIDEIKYRRDVEKYNQLYETKKAVGNFGFKIENENRILSDYRANAGGMDSHYFFQDIIVASLIIREKVLHHWDIGSRIDGFISHLLAGGVNTTVMDIRPYQEEIDIGYGVAKLDFIQADATELLNISDRSIKSLSALHSIEHFGLGRYGDEVAPDAWAVALHSLARVLAVNGTLYLSVPVGQTEKVCFNAHRIFRPETICETLDELDIQAMYLIHNSKVMQFDKGEVNERKYLESMGEYDCGIFVFVRKS